MSTDRSIAIIPARGGSKGVPRKNLRKIGGRSLIARTILAAKAAARVDGVYVSTDDPEISAAALAAGAEVIQRPAEISGDTASSEAALLHALEVLEADGVRPDRLAFLQCTSPFTTGAEIDQCLAALDDAAVSATFAAKLDHGFYWETGADGLAAGVNHDDKQPRKRRQDLTPQYRETGSIYAMRVKDFKAAGVRFCGPTVLTPIDGPLIEIDTLEDLAICEAMAAQREGPAREALDFGAVRALVMDFDGVLTDDRVLVLEDGREGVIANRGDGLGLGRLRETGLPLLILSKEVNPVVSARGRKLKIEVSQGQDDKLTAVTAWLEREGLKASDIAYIGNDINDLPCLEIVGYPLAPADARPEVRAVAKYVTAKPGGFGAVREICDLILAAKSAR
jgi:YrbI family 3-deoxy-D-manno-octulosonate 8-phosphate phosphatase